MPASRAKPPAPRRCESAPRGGPGSRSYQLPDAGIGSCAAAGRARNLRQYTTGPLSVRKAVAHVPFRLPNWTWQHGSAQVNMGEAAPRPGDLTGQ